MSSDTKADLTEIGTYESFFAKVARLCQYVSTVFLFLYALAAPHSIAGSQGGFLISAFFFLLASLLDKSWLVRRTGLEIPFFGLFLFATLSSAFSYEPQLSVKGLRNLAFFSAFYLVMAKATDRVTIRWLALTLMLSCLVNVGLSFYQKALGQGLKIEVMHPHSHLDRSGLLAGDVLLKANGENLDSLEELYNIVEKSPQNARIRLEIRRGELLLTFEFTKKRLLSKRSSGAESFGLEVTPARDFRAKGFYSHYATYAEVLQLIASLYFGILLTCSNRKLQLILGILAISVTTALIFTATHAPLFGLVCSVLVQILILGKQTKPSILKSKKFAIAALAFIAMIIGIYAVAVWRGVGIVDPNDGSLSWRLQVWKEGLTLIARDPILGIGRGSEKLHWKEWGLYNDGKLPPGHFHSTPLQVAVWWGLPALGFLVLLMYKIISTLIKNLTKHPPKDWICHGIVLGSLGGVCGFCTSSFVHFNFGDGEVIMVLWLLVGLAFSTLYLEEQTLRSSNVTEQVLTFSRI